MSTPYITSIERRGIEKGLQRGLAAERTLLQRLAERRFGEATATPFAALLQAIDDPERLAEIGEWLIDCGTGEELLARVRAVQE